jgi:hypothetical protein
MGGNWMDENIKGYCIREVKERMKLIMRGILDIGDLIRI